MADFGAECVRRLSGPAHAVALDNVYERIPTPMASNRDVLTSSDHLPCIAALVFENGAPL